MGIINNQRLTTGDNRNFNSGFPIFPRNTSVTAPRKPESIGAGYGPRRSQTLFDSSIPLALFRVNLNANMQSVAGAFFGFQMGYNVEGETRNDGSAFLRFSSEFMQGGIGVGCGVTFNFTARIDEAVINFNFQDGFTSSWRNLFTFSASAIFDALELAVNFLGSVLNLGQLQALSEIKQVASNGAIWGLFASNATPGLTRGSTLDIRPRANFNVNILEFIPKLGPIIKKAGKKGVKFSVGPTVVILFPLVLRIARLVTEDGVYTPNGTSPSPTPRDANARIFNFSGPTGTFARTVNSVEIIHSHTVSFELSLEIRASFSFLKIISLSAALRIPLNLEGANPATAGPFHTALSNSENLAQQIELPEVVWG